MEGGTRKALLQQWRLRTATPRSALHANSDMTIWKRKIYPCVYHASDYSNGNTSSFSLRIARYCDPLRLKIFSLHVRPRTITTHTLPRVPTTGDAAAAPQAVLTPREGPHPSCTFLLNDHRRDFRCRGSLPRQYRLPTRAVTAFADRPILVNTACSHATPTPVSAPSPPAGDVAPTTNPALASVFDVLVVPVPDLAPPLYAGYAAQTTNTVPEPTFAPAVNDLASLVRR